MITVRLPKTTNDAYEWWHLLKTYKKYVRKNSVVVHMGSSTPAYSQDLGRHCARVIGVELMPERIPASFGNVTYIQGDWQKCTKVLPANGIDIMVSSHTIEHVEDDVKSLNETYAVLKPKGILLMNTPNINRLPIRLVELVKGRRKFPYLEHVREYSELTLISLIRKSKFKRFRIQPVSLGLNGGPLHIYTTAVPRFLRSYATFFEVILFKE